MFTGLVEALGEICGKVPVPAGFRLRVGTHLSSELAPGDSLAVNGVCLTIVSASNGEVEADVSPETIRVTALGSLAARSLVNLERPLRADARLGGHFVQGHVDATGTIADIRKEGDAYRLTIAHPAELAPCIVLKGSIAVDGISLTVARLELDRFDVQIVPYTWEHTNLSTRRTGDAVNLECDILGKYVRRVAELSGVIPASPPARGDQ